LGVFAAIVNGELWHYITDAQEAESNRRMDHARSMRNDRNLVCTARSAAVRSGRSAFACAAIACRGLKLEDWQARCARVDAGGG
jgi:hypothetical protein